MNKEESTLGQITFSFIWRYIVYFLLASMVFWAISNIITKNLNDIVSVIVSLITSFFVVYMSCKLSTYDSFKKKSLDSNNVSLLMRNIIIFFVIAVICIGTFYIIDYQSSMNRYNNYIEQRENRTLPRMFDVQSKPDISPVIITIFINTVIYAVMIPIQKKFILKYNT